MEPILASTEEGLDILRHSASHLMAQAIKRLYPGTKLGIGPAVEDGFYYDVDPPQSLTEDDLQKIEGEMGRIVKEALPVERLELPRDEVISIFKERGETYKLELIEEIEDPFISLYRQGDRPLQRASCAQHVVYPSFQIALAGRGILAGG